MQVSVVPPEYVATVWPQVEKFITDAAAYTGGRFAEDDARALVDAYGYQLWVALDGADIRGAVVTGVHDYPKKRVLQMLFCGGDEGPEWKSAMLGTLRRWAAENQCAAIEAHGRIGWARVFKDDGYTPLWQVFELPVEVGE